MREVLGAMCWSAVCRIVVLEECVTVVLQKVGGSPTDVGVVFCMRVCVCVCVCVCVVGEGNTLKRIYTKKHRVFTYDIVCYQFVCRYPKLSYDIRLVLYPGPPF